MAALSPAHVGELLDTAAQLAHERRPIAEVLDGLPATVGELRAAVAVLAPSLIVVHPLDDVVGDHRTAGRQRSQPGERGADGTVRGMALTRLLDGLVARAVLA